MIKVETTQKSQGEYVAVSKLSNCVINDKVCKLTFFPIFYLGHSNDVHI